MHSRSPATASTPVPRRPFDRVTARPAFKLGPERLPQSSGILLARPDPTRPGPALHRPARPGPDRHRPDRTGPARPPSYRTCARDPAGPDQPIPLAEPGRVSRFLSPPTLPPPLASRSRPSLARLHCGGPKWRSGVAGRAELYRAGPEWSSRMRRSLHAPWNRRGRPCEPLAREPDRAQGGGGRGASERGVGGRGYRNLALGLARACAFFRAYARARPRAAPRPCGPRAACGS